MHSHLVNALLTTFLHLFLGEWPATLKQHEIIQFPSKSPAINDIHGKAISFATKDIASIHDRIIFWNQMHENATRRDIPEKLTKKYKQQLFKARIEYLRYSNLMNKYPEIIPIE